MTAFESDVLMTFAGTLDPVCYIEIKSVGSMKPEQTKAMSQDFCQQINQVLGVDKNRIYIEFADAKGERYSADNRRSLRSPVSRVQCGVGIILLSAEF